MQPDLFALLTDTGESGIIVIRRATGLNDMTGKIREYYGSTPTKLRYGKDGGE